MAYISIIDVLYPIGTIVCGVWEEKTPAEIFGGSWEKIEDAYLAASGSGSFTNPGTNTGTYYLKANHIPGHSHTVRGANTPVSTTASDWANVKAAGCLMLSWTHNGDYASKWTAGIYTATGGGYTQEPFYPYCYQVSVWRRIE